jgi:hypothetical protein
MLNGKENDQKMTRITTFLKNSNEFFSIGKVSLHLNFKKFIDKVF